MIQVFRIHQKIRQIGEPFCAEYMVGPFAFRCVTEDVYTSVTVMSTESGSTNTTFEIFLIFLESRLLTALLIVSHCCSHLQ